ncbi:DUF3108 domain-containing protein, partial [Pseudomonas syringae pv. tagetis]
MRRAQLYAFALLELTAVQAADHQPYSATYTADWKQLPMTGTAEPSLEAEANRTMNQIYNAYMMN